jgi:GNAT superfamily N-acetyltransferase
MRSPALAGTHTDTVDAMDDAELARRSLRGFGEMVAALGRGEDRGAEVRWPNAVGARMRSAAGNPFFDAVIVPAGAVPPPDDPRLPYCVWTVEDAVPGRMEEAAIATPCMGVALDDPALDLRGPAPEIETPPLRVVGDVNERAYGDFGTFSPLLQAVRDDRIRVHGLRDEGVFVCVAVTLSAGDDVSIHFVATEASHRRRGLASRLMLAVLAEARDQGMRTATLQASADGLPVWERLGFRRVATLRGYLRPDAGAPVAAPPP